MKLKIGGFKGNYFYSFLDETWLCKHETQGFDHAPCPPPHAHRAARELRLRNGSAPAPRPPAPGELRRRAFLAQLSCACTEISSVTSCVCKISSSYSRTHTGASSRAGSGVGTNTNPRGRRRNPRHTATNTLCWLPSFEILCEKRLQFLQLNLNGNITESKLLSALEHPDRLELDSPTATHPHSRRPGAQQSLSLSRFFLWLDILCVIKNCWTGSLIMSSPIFCHACALDLLPLLWYLAAVLQGSVFPLPPPPASSTVARLTQALLPRGPAEQPLKHPHCSFAGRL